MTIILREARDADRHFIQDSWRKSLWKNEIDQNAVPWDSFFEGLEAFWKVLDSLPGTFYLVAEFKDVPGEVLGYAIHLSTTECLWAYVKAPYRRQGIGTALVRDAKRFGTVTRSGKVFARSLGATFDPFMMFTPKH